MEFVNQRYWIHSHEKMGEQQFMAACGRSFGFFIRAIPTLSCSYLLF